MTQNLNFNSTNLGSWNFDHSYSKLPNFFYENINPVPVTKPSLLIFNYKLSKDLGLNSDQLTSPEGIEMLAGNSLPEGANSIAQAYAGHQFGHFTMLGDGRAVLLGEHLCTRGKRFDIQLKGSGKTPFSRRGDGRAAIAPMLREYIISEAMHALNIPTTRSLAVISTGDDIFRESALPGAILTRVAESHIRVGTFEYAARFGNPSLLKLLADYTINRHFPEIIDSENKYLVFLESVIEKQALLISKWLQVGFIHGVMNTDNMAISGETIDYGPCAFMDHYHEHKVFSSIDFNGRYSYGNQAVIAQWNLARFAETLLTLLDGRPEKAITLANQAIENFSDQFNQYWISGMRKKLGLFNQEPEDLTLIESFLDFMQKHQIDFTFGFRSLASNKIPDDLAFQNDDFKNWHLNWQNRLNRQKEQREESYSFMNSHNPAIIPRNYKIEEALKAASEADDLSLTNNLLKVLEQPFDETEENFEYRKPASQINSNYRTFCGT